MDMSERKNSLGSKKKYTQKGGAFPLAFSQNPAPMWVCDLKSLKIIHVNEALLNLAGHENVDLETLALENFFSSKDIALFLPNLKKIPVERCSLGHWRLRHKKNRLIWVELFLQAFDAESKTARILLTAKPLALNEATIPPHGYNQLDHAVFENLRGVIIFSLDAQYRYLAFTSLHKETMRLIWNAEIEIGMNMLDYITRADDRAKAKHNFDQALHGELVTLDEEYGEAQEAKRIWWENRYSPVYGANGEIVGLTVLVIDITRRKQVENALRINEARLRSITANVPDYIVEVDKNGLILFTNHPMSDVEAQNALGQDFCKWVSDEYVSLAREKLALAYSSGNVQEYEALSMNHLGELRWYMTYLSPVIVNNRTQSVVLISRDITARKKAVDDILSTKEAVENMNEILQKAFEREQIASRTDTLTGAYNRRYFFEFIEYEILVSQRYQNPLSVILFDVDDFKRINDSYGHLFGDKVLVRIVQTVQEEIRNSDVLARYGGDEFIILVPNSSLESVHHLIERIRQKIERLVFRERQAEIKITISAGVASMQSHINTPTKLVQEADNALYNAKQAGKNRAAYAPRVDLK